MGSLKELHITSDRINDGQFHQRLNRAFNDQFLFEIMLKEQSFAIICC